MLRPHKIQRMKGFKFTKQNSIPNRKIAVVLHNVRSIHNVGSIFRTSDGAGVEKIFLCGITPVPVDRFGKYLRDIQKVALGAEKTVEWEKISNTVSLLKKLKKDGWKILAVEQSKKSVPYFSFPLGSKDKLAVVLGAEVKGLPVSILKGSDSILEIPMFGSKESLNVSVSAGIILFSVRCRHK